MTEHQMAVSSGHLGRCFNFIIAKEKMERVQVAE